MLWMHGSIYLIKSGSVYLSGIVVVDDEYNVADTISEVGIKEIQWLCHTYFPQITSSVQKRISELNQ